MLHSENNKLINKNTYGKKKNGYRRN